MFKSEHNRVELEGHLAYLCPAHSTLTHHTPVRALVDNRAGVDDNEPGAFDTVVLLYAHSKGKLTPIRIIHHCSKHKRAPRFTRPIRACHDS